AETVGIREDDAAFDLNSGAEEVEPFQVKIHWPGADVAAAGLGDLRLAVSGQHRTKDIERGAHLASELFRSDGAPETGGVDLDTAVGTEFNPGPDEFENLAHGADVPDVRNVVQDGLAFDQQTGRHEGQAGVLAAAHPH